MGKSIYSQSLNLKFSVCKPGTTNTPETYIKTTIIDDDLECSLELCTLPNVGDNGVKVGTTGIYDIPAIGCKMSTMITIFGDLTIKGLIGSYHELQANRIDHSQAGWQRRHFSFDKIGAKLTLKFLKLTWGEVGTGYQPNGGFIYMLYGTLDIDSVYFYGFATATTNTLHADKGGAIFVNNGIVKIKESTFEGFSANEGGAIYVSQTSTPMTIESTTFKNNKANVSFIFTGI
jgi:hypothetical protein